MSRVCVVGSFMMDLVARAPRRPHPGETLAGRSFTTYLGGKGFNQAVAARQYGVDVSFIGMLGTDAFGQEFIAGLDAHGIEHSHVMRHPDIGTGVGLPVVEDSGQNSIIIVPRANLAITPADLDAARSVIAASDVLAVQLELPLDVVTRAAEIAHSAGTTVVLNPAPFQDLPPELLELVNILVPNEVEAQAFTGAADSSPDALVTAMRENWDRPAVLTLGARGVAVLEDGNATHIAALPLQPVDTVGAGDTFCGVLCAALAEDLTLLDAARVANAASSIAVTRPGGSTSAPSREDIHAEMAAWSA